MEPNAYASHPLWSDFEVLKNEYEKFPTPDVAVHAMQVEAVGAGIRVIEQYAPEDYDEALLVSDQAIANAHAHLSNVRQFVTQFAANPADYSPLVNAYTHLVQNLVPYLQAQFPAPTPTALNAAAKRAFTIEANRLKTEVIATKKTLVDAQTAHEAQRQALADEFAALATAAQQTDAKVASLSTTLNAQIDEQRTAFEAEAKQRATAAKEELDGIITQANTDRSSLTEQAEALLEDIQRHRDASEALVDTTSRNAIAGDYGAWAQKQGRSAGWWTAATVLVGLATVAVLVYVLNHDSGNSTQFAIYKTGISVVMLIVAGYCASQAAEHRREERTAKRLHLDLAALEPFLKQVKDPEELRTQIALRVFAPQAEEVGRAKARLSFGRSLSYDQILNLVTLIKKAE